MTITETGDKYGLTADTLRYYERIGLLPPVPRNSGGFRDYDEEACNWVQFIKCMRDAGVSVETLAEYVSLFGQGTATIAARKTLLVEQREKLAEKIETLQAVLARLERKIDGYEERMIKCEQDLKLWD